MARFYMLVSNNQLELPMSRPMTAQEMAKVLKCTPKNISVLGSPSQMAKNNKGINDMTKTGRNKPYKLVGVTLDKGDE